MKSRGHIDRHRDDADIFEHVIGGLRTERADAHTRVTDLDVQPWLGGTVLTVSAAQVRVLNRDE